MFTGYDFGYTWPWTYGHLIFALFLGIPLLVFRKRLPVWVSVLLGAGAVWGLAGFIIVQYVFRFNLPVQLPTANFYHDGSGEALDVGSGSGRTTIGLALARPGSKIAALDNFSADYIKDNGEARLRQNVKAAGIDQSRVRVIEADMRKIPAPDNTFNAVISSYAIDHLDRAGIKTALHEVNRVLAPGGDFLLMVIRADAWLKTVYGPMLLHARKTPSSYWPDRLTEAGFQIIEQGTSPGSLHFVCRKPAITSKSLQ